jgi:glycosyltransferase involved in cell wall biosynthesis
MRIVVNTRLLIRNRLDGIGWFTRQTLQRITNAHPDVHFVFLFDREFDPEFIFSDNVTPLILSPRARHPFLYFIWFQFSVRSLLQQMKPDLFLSPDGFLVLGSEFPQLAVMHDINFLHYPRDHRRISAWYYNFFFPRFARKAVRIATVSEFSKMEISKNYHIPAEKIDVVYSGINPFFHPLDSSGKQSAQKKFANGDPYYIYVGSLHPRKNIPALIRAYSLFRSKNESRIKLVLAGPGFWGMKAIREAILQSKFQDDIIQTERLTDQDLALALGGALALTFVSYYEGFGIPLIEAMACDVPVIASNGSGLAEIAGDAALLVNPHQVEEIGDAMVKVASSEKLRDELIAKGRVQRQKYSWDRTADLLWQSVVLAMRSGR